MTMTDAAAEVQEQFERMAYLEELYLLDGRDKLDHPLCGRFTGLFEKYGPKK